MLFFLKKFWFVLKGDRFGGALDGAAKQFSEGYDAGMIPMEFVNTMRKKGQLIMGIGHRVKSVSLESAFLFIYFYLTK
jgi:citrate synthase